METIIQALSIAVLLALAMAMLFTTKAIKEKKDANVKKQHSTKAWICFGVYIVLNVVRYVLEKGVL